MIQSQFRWVLCELVRRGDSLDVNQISWFPSEVQAYAVRGFWQSRGHNVWVMDRRSGSGNYVPVQVIERAWLR